MARFSIRTRLIVILTFILAFGFLTTNIISYRTSRNLVRTGILGNSLPLARDNIYSEIQRDLMRPIFVSSLMANDTFLKDWVIRGERDLVEIVRYLTEIKKRYGFFTSFFVSDLTHRYYHFSGLHKTISEADAHDVWYYRFRDLNVEYDLDVDTNQAEQNRLTIFINHRLTGSDGTFLGVVGVGLNFDIVAELLDSYQKKYNRDVYMISRDGLIQVHTRRDHILKTNIFHQPGIGRVADRIVATRDEPTFFEYDTDGQHILLTCRYVRELDWYLLVEQNENRAMATVNQTFMNNLMLSLLITSISILITILVINYFQKQLENMAIRDKMTQAFNRNECERRFNNLSAMVRRKLIDLSMIMVDIDRFKIINDTRGHVFGDEVIKNFARLAGEMIRENDVLVRWGGDEFIILVPGDVTQAETLAGRLFEAVAKFDFYATRTDPTQDTLPITISCGIAPYHPDDDLDAFVHRADQALYIAKHKGRNRIVSMGTDA